MKRLVGFLSKYSLLIVISSFVLTGFMATGLKRIHISQESAESMFTNASPLIRSVLNINKTFGADTRRIVISVETQGDWRVTEPHTLELISKITSNLKSLPSIRRETLLSLFTLGSFEVADNDLTSRPLVNKIPQNEAEENALAAEIEKNDFIYGRLVSKDFKTTLIVASADEKADLAAIHEQVSHAVGLVHPLPGVKVSLVGEPELIYQLEASIMRDIVIFVFISLIFILLSFYIMFRTWRGVVLPLLALSQGIIWTMGIMGFSGQSVSMISAILPVALVVVGSAYSIHILHHLIADMEHGHGFHAALLKTFEEILPSTAMATLATFIGGIALLAFKIRAIQHFGAFLALGTAISFMMAFILIPCLYKVLRRPIRHIENTVRHGIHKAGRIAKKTIHHVPLAGPMTEAIAQSASQSVRGAATGFKHGFKSSDLMGKTLRATARLAITRPAEVIAVTVLVVLTALHFMSKIEIGFDNLSLLPLGMEARTSAQRVDKTFGGTQTFELMIDFGQPNGLLKDGVVGRMNTLEKSILTIPGVSYATSIVDILKKTHALLAPQSKEELPQSKEALSQYLLLLSMSGGGGLSLKNLMTSDSQKMRMLVTVNTLDTHQMEMYYRLLLDKCKDQLLPTEQVEIGGGPVVWVALMRSIVWGKIQNILISLLLIVALIAVVHRSIVRGLLTVLTLLVGVFCVFGLMGIAGIRLDMSTAIITGFSLGLGGDFSIHLVDSIKRAYDRTKDMASAIEQSIVGPGRAIAFNALSNIAGFGSLLLSQFPTIHTFAILMCVSMFVLLVSSLLILPSIMRLFPPSFITGRSPRNLYLRRRNLIMKVAASFLFFISVGYGIAWSESQAAEKGLPTASSLVRKTIQAIHTKNEDSIYVMKLIGSGGDVMTRKMHVWFKSDGEKSAKLLLKFTEPADIRGTAFLTQFENGKGADQWLYLPALKKSRRIKGGNADESFMGSDFTIRDLSVDADDGLAYTVTGVKPCGSFSCYEVVGLPRDPATAGDLVYSKRVLMIRKDCYISVRSEFYNSGKQLEKLMTISGIHRQGTRWLADKVEMKNLLTNHSTVLEFENRDTQKVPEDYLFTPQNLERQ